MQDEGRFGVLVVGENRYHNVGHFIARSAGKRQQFLIPMVTVDQLLIVRPACREPKTLDPSVKCPMLNSISSTMKVMLKSPA